jgi:hypothetical protein
MEQFGVLMLHKAKCSTWIARGVGTDSVRGMTAVYGLWDT